MIATTETPVRNSANYARPIGWRITLKGCGYLSHITRVFGSTLPQWSYSMRARVYPTQADAETDVERLRALGVDGTLVVEAVY
jgi:hypothetical protein